MRSSSLGIYHPGGVFHPSATNIGQFGKLTDRTAGESLSLSLPKGPAPSSPQRMRGSILSFNILGFPAFTKNDGRWFLSPEGGNVIARGKAQRNPG